MSDKADKIDSSDEGGAPRIFVCYSHRDDSIVIPEVQWLRAQSLDVWYDEGISAGTIWRQEIADAIDRADVVVFFVSSSSIESEHCRREIHYALDHNKRTLPVYLEDVELPGDLQLGLSYIQALSISGSQYRDRLIGAIKGDSDSPAEFARSKERPGKSPFRRAATAAIALVVVAASWWVLNEYRTPNNDFESMQDLEMNVLSKLHIGITLPQDLSGSDIGSAWVRVVADDLTESLLEGTNFKVSALYGAGAPRPEDFSGQYLIRGRITGESDHLEASLELVRWPENATIDIETTELPTLGITPSTFQKAGYFASRLEDRIRFYELRSGGDFFTDPRAEALFFQVVPESIDSLKAGGSTQPAPISERLALLHKAAEYDPEVPIIYSALATTYADAISQSDDPEEMIRLAYENVERALELATGRFARAQATVHYAAGYVNRQNGDYEAALRHFELAEAKGWGVDQVRFQTGWLNLKTGNFEQAINDFKTAKRLGGIRQEPWVTQDLIRAQAYSGRYEEALESIDYLQGLVSQGAESRLIPWFRIMVYASQGKLEEAQKVWIRLREFADSLDDGFRAGWLPLVGEEEEARKLLDELEQRWQAGENCSVIDCRYTYVGSYYLDDLDQAFVWLNRVLDAKELGMIERVYSVEFASLHADPRFENIRNRIDSESIRVPRRKQNSAEDGP